MLTSHVGVSVGWLGSVVVFLVFAIAGLTSTNTKTIQAAYIAMGMCAWFVIVPASFGALITGIAQALGTQWGLFKHYWVIVKLGLTVIATVILMVHMQPIDYMADFTTRNVISTNDLRGLRIQLIADAGAALVVLLGITAISIYKPWGKIGVKRTVVTKKVMSKKTLGRIVLIALICVILAFIISHIAGGGMNHH